MTRQRILTPERTRSSSHIFHRAREIVELLLAEFDPIHAIAVFLLETALSVWTNLGFCSSSYATLA